MYLDQTLAMSFIKTLCKTTDYNLNIMNETGEIIASRDSMRIGELHVVARKIMTSDIDEIETREKTAELSHVGVNAAIKHNGQKIGVIGITGDPNKVYDILKILRVTLEKMLEYEFFKDAIYQRRSIREQFGDTLIYGDVTIGNSFEYYRRNLHYLDHHLRMPILVSFRKSDKLSDVVRRFSEELSRNPQDISAVTRGNNIMLFWEVNFSDIKYDHYKYIAEEFIERIKEKIGTDYQPHFYIDAPQREFAYCRASFLRCVWLSSHLRDEELAFINDNITNYMDSLLPKRELTGVFSAYEELLEDKEAEAYIELVEALEKHNYNLNDTSKALFIHKNTLVFRINKLKEKLGLESFHTQENKALLRYFCEYLRQNNKIGN